MVILSSLVTLTTGQLLDYDLEVDIKNIESFYVNDGSIFSYDIYYHNNGSQTVDDVVLSTSLYPFASIVTTSQPGTSVASIEYGLEGDVCLPDLYNSIGHYMDVLDQFIFLVTEGSVSSLSDFLAFDLQDAVDAGEMTVEQKDFFVANPGTFLFDVLLPSEGMTFNERFYDIGIPHLIQEGYITIDPSCGMPGPVALTEWGLGSILPGGGGYISVYAQLLQNTTSTIDDTGTFASDMTIQPSSEADGDNGTIFRTFTNESDGSTSLFFNKHGGPLLFNNQTILDSVIDESMTEQEKAIAIWQLVKDHTFNYHNLGEEPWSRGSWWMQESDERDPVQGLNTLYGMCGEINGVFASLLDMAGLQAVRAEFSGHIATEVLIDGQWAFMDADGGAYWTNGSGRIYSVAELEQDPSIMYDNLGDYPEGYADVIASSGDNQSDRGDIWSNSDHTMLLTLHEEDNITYIYYGYTQAEDERYTEGRVTRSVLHDTMLSGLSSTEFSVVEYIPYAPIRFELLVDAPLENDVFVYLKEQYTDTEVLLGRLHNRIGYNLNETVNAFGYEEKYNYSYTLRFVCPDGCDVEDLTSRIQLETTFIFNYLSLPYDTAVDLYINSFSGSSASIASQMEYDTYQKVGFSASITGSQSDAIIANNTRNIMFNTLNHNYAILPMSGGLLQDVLEYKGYVYDSGLSLFGEDAFVGQAGLDLHNTLTIADDIVMTDPEQNIHVLLHSGVTITPSGTTCGNEFLLAPEDMTDLSGSTAAMTFVVGSACAGRTLSFSEDVRIRLALDNAPGDTILAQVSADGENRSTIDATRIDDNTIELLAPHFSTFQVFVSAAEEDEISTNPGPGGTTLEKDDCPDGDNSGSYYDGKCEGEDDTATDDVATGSGLVEDIQEDSSYCIYDDGDFRNYVFSDVVGTKYENAVATLLHHCLVHGYGNEGKVFGVYNATKLGELYKIFARLALLEFDTNLVDSHWSDPYKIAGESIGLWNGIRVQDQESFVTYRDLLLVTINYLHYIGFLEDTIPLRYNDYSSVFRGDLSAFISMLIQSL